MTNNRRLNVLFIKKSPVLNALSAFFLRLEAIIPPNKKGFLLSAEIDLRLRV